MDLTTGLSSQPAYYDQLMHSSARERFGLVGRTAWVVGGAGLLGAAASRALAEHGAHVVVSGRDANRAEEFADSLRDEGLSAESLTVDAGEADSVTAAVAKIKKSHGRLDVCVNFSYLSTGASFDDMTPKQWEAGLRVTGTGAFLVGREAGRAMEQGGSIVQLSSMYGMVAPDPRAYPSALAVNPPDYGFAKAGVLQLVRYQAVQLAPRGIRVNAVSPGPFPGPAVRDNDEFMRRLAQRVPLGRLGEPREIEGAVVFLASDASSFVTGSNLVVDGGWTAW